MRSGSGCLNAGLDGAEFDLFSSAGVTGVAGAIALGLGSSIKAPHGGIFVIIGTDFNHILQTLIALVVGTLVSALIYGFLKPKVTENEIQASQAMDE